MPTVNKQAQAATPITLVDTAFDLPDSDLLWHTPRRRVKVGDIAGAIEVQPGGHQYRRVRFNGFRFYAHHLAFVKTHKRWPEGDLDHIDGNGLNNHPDNLREATHTENMQNRRKHRNNTSGYKGVSWIRRYGKWQATISVNGKNINLGRFDCKVEAARAYNQAAIQHYGDRAELNKLPLETN